MTPGLIVLLVAVGLAVAFGIWRQRRDGAFARSRQIPSVLAGTELADQLGERATLLQFSSAFCAPCRATRRTLSEVAEVVPGVVHLEVDAESHLDLVRALGILRTPTTLVLDAAGHEVTRAAGAPRKEQVLAALGSVADGRPGLA